MSIMGHQGVQDECRESRGGSGRRGGWIRAQSLLEHQAQRPYLAWPVPNRAARGIVPAASSPGSPRSHPAGMSESQDAMQASVTHAITALSLACATAPASIGYALSAATSMPLADEVRAQPQLPHSDRSTVITLLAAAIHAAQAARDREPPPDEEFARGPLTEGGASATSTSISLLRAAGGAVASPGPGGARRLQSRGAVPGAWGVWRRRGVVACPMAMAAPGPWVCHGPGIGALASVAKE